jgi:chromosome segregation ATPase
MGISIKEHFNSLIQGNKDLSESQDRRLEELIESLNEKMELNQKASQLAQEKFESSVANNFIKTNEFRGSLEDLSKNMATRRELETAVATISNNNNEIDIKINELRSRLDVGNPMVQSLQSRIDTSSGVKQGEGEILTRIATILGITATLITIIIKLL